MEEFTEMGARTGVVDECLRKMNAIKTETVTEAMSEGILIDKLEAAMRIHKYDGATVIPQSVLIFSYDFRDLTPKSCRIMNRLTKIVRKGYNQRISEDPDSQITFQSIVVAIFQKDIETQRSF